MSKSGVVKGFPKKEPKPVRKQKSRIRTKSPFIDMGVGFIEWFIEQMDRWNRIHPMCAMVNQKIIFNLIAVTIKEAEEDGRIIMQTNTYEDRRDAYRGVFSYAAIELNNLITSEVAQNILPGMAGLLTAFTKMIR